MFGLKVKRDFEGIEASVTIGRRVFGVRLYSRSKYEITSLSADKIKTGVISATHTAPCAVTEARVTSYKVADAKIENYEIGCVV